MREQLEDCSNRIFLLIILIIKLKFWSKVKTKSSYKTGRRVQASNSIYSMLVTSAIEKIEPPLFPPPHPFPLETALTETYWKVVTCTVVGEEQRISNSSMWYLRKYFLKCKHTDEKLALLELEITFLKGIA